MKNTELIRNFINGETKGKGSNLKIEGNELINYFTVIAFRNTEKNEIVLNNESYSQTTKVHQNKIKREALNLIVFETDTEFSNYVLSLGGDN